MSAPKKQTFDTPEAAIANARKLFENGEITRQELQNVVRTGQEALLKEFLGKTYGDRKKR